MSVSVNCLIAGQASKDVFSIPIGIYVTVGGIKVSFDALTVSMFKEFLFQRPEMQELYDNKLNKKKIDLYKVEIKLEDLKNKIYTKDEIEGGIVGEVMEPMRDIEDYFNNKDKVPVRRRLHIFIVPITGLPQQGITQEPVATGHIDVRLPYTPRQGGLGGTKFKRSEGDRIGNYEGINLKNSDICRREQTIKKLVKKIDEAGFLLIRSPPMSGKTSLGQLLEQHLVEDFNKIRVIRISLLWMGTSSGLWTFEEGFQRLMGITWENFQNECVHIKTIFIVDGVQMLYVPQGETASRHNGNVFWETIKRCLQIGNLHIVAFATYGYKGAWDRSSATRTIDVSPFMIPYENTWGTEDMRFTKDEYEDYFLRFCRTHLKRMKNENDIKFLQEYVNNTTARHPGLVAFFMNHIRDHFSPQLKYDDTLTFERIFLYLKSYKFMWAVDDGFRGHMQNFTPGEEELCDRIFRGPIDIRMLYNTSKKTRLVWTNLLSEQDGKLDFASPYLRALYLQRRWGSTTRPTNPPQDFKSFLRGTFTNMNAKTIRNSYCIGTDDQLLERAWQMEFYRAATQVLPLDIFISPDVGTSGYVDFFVDDDQKWSIKLLRDGENAPNHKKRFETGGIYVPIREASKEWAIIDIREPGLSNPVYSADLHWINVYCQANWKSVIIEDKDGRVEVQLMGEYQ